MKKLQPSQPSGQGPSQLDLFDSVREMDIPGAWNATRQWRRQVSESLTRARLALGKDRFAVAAEVARMLDAPFSEAVLNQYSAESRDNYQLPGNKIAPLCRATLDLSLVKLILEPLARCPETRPLLEALLIRIGIPIIGQERDRLAQLGQAVVESKKSRQDALQLLRELMDEVR